MNWGDVPAWAALGISSVAAAVAFRSAHWEKQSAKAADKSANEAARANLIAERALEAKTVKTADEQPPRITWKIERGTGAQFILRNTGSATAEHVYADQTRAPIINRNLPDDSVIREGAGHRMLLAGSMQRRMPTELYLRWTGHDEWFAVPLPS